VPFAEAWAVEAVVPFRVFSTTIQYTDLDGRPIVLDYPNIHHRDETLWGIADPWLSVRHTLALGRLSLGAQLGATIPLGRTEENPYRLGEEGKTHEHVQFGTGTVDPLAALNAAVDVGSGFSVFAWGLGIFPLYENGKGYQAGMRGGAGLGASSALGFVDWRFRLGADLSFESAERWDGKTYGEGNTGRIDVAISAGTSYAFAAGWSAIAGVKVPLYTHVVGGQFGYPGVVELGVSWTLGHHHHAHEEVEAEGAPADWTGVDVTEIAPSGEAVDLAPVPGQITVFDFWASWCVPCHELDRLVAALAHAHPGRIAVRKLRVETWDSPAARRYLSDAPSLPHVEVYGADGARAFEKSGDPHAIVEAIEDLL
jgi:thiol-disulfide isomerase/thioredoxin